MQMNRSWLMNAFWLILFVISYAVVSVIGFVWLARWDSPLHWLIPVPAFFLTVWALQWSQTEFKLRATSLWWPVLILVLGFVAFFVAQFFYWCNGFTDIWGTNSTCSAAGAQQAFSFIAAQWGDLLVRDGFFYFWMMVLLAWVSLRVFELAAPAPRAVKTRARKKA